MSSHPNPGQDDRDSAALAWLRRNRPWVFRDTVQVGDPGQSAAERRILNLCRERDGLFERLDRIDSTSPERAQLLGEVTAINRRIYICELERER